MFKAKSSLAEQIATDLAGRISRAQLPPGEWSRRLQVLQARLECWYRLVFAERREPVACV